MLVCNVWVLVCHADPPSTPTSSPCVSIQNASVCAFKTSPCVLGTRPHAQSIRTCCGCTRRRFESTHGEGREQHEPDSQSESRYLLRMLFSSGHHEENFKGNEQLNTYTKTNTYTFCKHAHVFSLEPSIHQSHPWRRWGLTVTSALTPCSVPRETR